jgi:hypothetical protein
MTTKMQRPSDGKMADVHPDEVENMRAHGWRVAEVETAPVSVPAVVDIPPEWAGLHWKQQVALAGKISARDDITKMDEAREIIAAEVARRAEG